jgi:hypothetical protein
MGVLTTNSLNSRAKIKITPSTFLDQPLGAVYYPIYTAQPHRAFFTAETIGSANREYIVQQTHK